MSAGAPESRLAAGRRPAVRDPGHAPRSRALARHLAALIQAPGLDDLLHRVARLAEELADGSAACVVLGDSESRSPGAPSPPRSPSARLSAEIAAFVADVDVSTELERGRPVERARPSGEALLVIPLTYDSRLVGVLGVVSRTPSRPASRAVEPLCELGQHAAPLLSRLREIEALRRTSSELSALVQRAERFETHRGEVEDRLRSLRAQLAMQSHLMANVNHALRTPLVAIRGYTRLLIDGVAGWSHTQQQYLDVVAQNAERLVDVTANLMAPHAVALRLSAVDLRAPWTEVMAAARARAEAAQVRLVDVAPAAPVPLLVDISRIRQMLAELVSGALETAESGDALHVELLDETERVVVTLTNGLPARPWETHGSGRSMRLETVREIANLHGGRFSVARDGGRALSVVLPRVSLHD